MLRRMTTNCEYMFRERGESESYAAVRSYLKKLCAQLCLQDVAAVRFLGDILTRSSSLLDEMFEYHRVVRVPEIVSARQTDSEDFLFKEESRTTRTPSDAILDSFAVNLSEALVECISFFSRLSFELHRLCCAVLRGKCFHSAIVMDIHRIPKHSKHKSVTLCPQKEQYKSPEISTSEHE